MDKQTERQLLEMVRQNYEKVADEFNQTRRKVLWPEITKLAAEVKYGASVLDVGCGNGRLREALKGKPVSYLGVDLSQSLVSLAAENDELKLPNQQFLVGDILELDRLTDKRFNYVFCLAVFHHLPGFDLRLKALWQVSRLLKPGGKIIISVWNLWRRIDLFWLIIKFGLEKLLGGNKMDWGDVVFDWRGNPASRRYYHAFRLSELKKMAGLSGLTVEKIYKDKYNYYLVLENRS